MPQQSFKVGVSWYTRGHLSNTTQCTAAIIQSVCVMVHSWTLAQYNSVCLGNHSKWVCHGALVGITQYNTVYRGNHSKWVCHGALVGITQYNSVLRQSFKVGVSWCTRGHYPVQHSVPWQSFKVGVSWCTRGHLPTVYCSNCSKWVCHSWKSYIDKARC